MAITMRTNFSSLDAQRNLSHNQTAVDNSMRKLASGYRITRAADDAAGLAISEKMRAQVTGTNQAIRNANDGISLIQTAEGGLGEMQNIVQRIRELAVQASNGTLVTADHAAIREEMTQINSEIHSISERTKFNGITLLGSDAGTLTLQIGADQNQTLEVGLSDFSSDGGALDDFGTAVGSYSGLTASNVSTGSFISKASSLIEEADSAIKAISNKRAELGAAQNRLDHTIAVQQVASDNLSAANSRIRDVDVAKESAEMTKNNILMQAAVSTLAVDSGEAGRGSRDDLVNHETRATHKCRCKSH